MRAVHTLVSVVSLVLFAACDGEKAAAPARSDTRTPASADAAPPTPPNTEEAAAAGDPPKTNGDEGAPAMVGKPAPDFELVDLDGNAHKLSDHAGKLVVLEWFNPGCPFVDYAHAKGPLRTMAAEQIEQGVVWLAINSGAPGKQ